MIGWDHVGLGGEKSQLTLTVPANQKRADHEWNKECVKKVKAGEYNSQPAASSLWKLCDQTPISISFCLYLWFGVFKLLEY